MDLAFSYSLCCNQLVCPAKNFERPKKTKKDLKGAIHIMKNNLIRAFVVTLALAGFGATTVSAHTAAKAKLSATTNESTPLCAPSDPSLCGLH